MLSSTEFILTAGPPSPERPRGPGAPMGPGIPFAPSFPAGPTGPGGPYIEEIQRININRSRFLNNNNSPVIYPEEP